MSEEVREEEKEEGKTDRDVGSFVPVAPTPLVRTLAMLRRVTCW